MPTLQLFDAPTSVAHRTGLTNDLYHPPCAPLASLFGCSPCDGVILRQPPPKESSSYRGFCIRNSSRVTHGGFDFGAQDRTIGNAWRAVYESGICSKSGSWLESIRDVSTPRDSGDRRCTDDGKDARSYGESHNGNVTGGDSPTAVERYASGGVKGAKGYGSSGSSPKVKNVICETVPITGSMAVEGAVSDSDGASESESRLRASTASASGGKGRGSSRAVSCLDDRSSDDGASGGSNGDQATIKDNAKRSGRGVDFKFSLCCDVVKNQVCGRGVTCFRAHKGGCPTS